MFSIDGLVSGLDTTSIIEGLVSLQKSQVERLNARKGVVVTEQTAFQGIEARMLSLRSSMSRLNRTTGSVFDKAVGSSSKEDILTVDAGDKATPGSYIVRVNSLARANQIGSQSFDDTSQQLTTGTIELRVGDRPASTITIDESNNTVAGLVTAINNQSDDVAASIVFDQANDGHRILLTSKHTGASNAISITNNLAASSGNAIQPDFSGEPIQQATNAQIQLGSGAGAIIAEYDTNQVEGLIENVTLNLSSANVDQDVTINVQRDTESAVEAIQGFVDEYNQLIEFIDQQTQYNPDTNVGGPLLGNRNVSNIKNRLSALVTETVPGLDPSLNRLSQIGVDIDTKGKLTLNSSQLQQALNGGLDGVEPSDIGRLFGLSGASDQNGVEFLLGSTRTEAGTFEVDILQAAKRGSTEATNAMAATTTIDSSNRAFRIKVDGLESGEILLDEGVYTQQELAVLVESRINNAGQLKGAEVNVTVVDGKLNIESQRYGRSSEISNLTGSAAAVLGFTGSEQGVGQDVAGSFIVNGVVETATGTGRVLIGDSSNSNTADLQIRVTLDESQVGDGVESTLEVSRGITARLDQYFGDVLDPDVGTMKTINEDFELRAESFDESIARVNQISEAKTAYLIEQFAALERVLSDLQSTSSFLTSQLASI